MTTLYAMDQDQSATVPFIKSTGSIDDGLKILFTNKIPYLLINDFISVLYGYNDKLIYDMHSVVFDVEDLETIFKEQRDRYYQSQLINIVDNI